MANGNLHLEIPIAAPSQRGSLTYPGSFVYNSRFWQAINYGTSSIWNPGYWGGLQALVENGWDKITVTATTNQCNGSYWYQYQNFTVMDGTDTQRLFPIYLETGNSCHTAAASTTSGYALDGSGYLISATLAGTGFQTNYVIAPDGTYWSGNGNYQTKPPRDPNGNEFSFDPESNVADTLDRSAASYVAAGTSGCPTSAENCYGILTPGGATSQVVVNDSNVYVQTAFDQPGVTEYHSQTGNVSSLQLPNGTEYQFGWDTGTSSSDTTPHYGDLTSITLPTGGVIEIGYTNFTDANGNVNRWVSSVSWNGGTWNFAPATNCGAGCQTVTVTAPSGDQTVYTFNVNQNAAWKSSIASYSGSASGGTLLSKTQYQYQSFTASSDFGGSAYDLLSSATTTLPTPSGNLMAKTTYGYDSNCSYTYRGSNYTCTLGKLLNTSEYAFGLGSPGGLYRQTVATYLDDQNSAYHSANIVNRPTDIKIENGSGGTAAETTIAYDSTPLTSITGVTNHDDTDYGTGNTVRGNPTVISRWAAGNTWLNTTLDYDTTGQVQKVTDPAGNPTSLSYVDQNAYPGTITNALNMSSSFGYDSNTGLLTSSTDANNQTTTFGYDEMSRPNLLSYPDGGQVQTTYNDTASPANIVTTTKLNSSSNRVDTTVLDGFGRVVQTDLNSDPAGTDYVNTNYDTSGRVASVTNPFRSTGDPTYGLTQYSYDGLGRPTLITEPDGNKLQWSYGGSSQYCPSATYGLGYPTVSGNEDGWIRTRWTDALGRLIEVDETDPSNVHAADQPTCYAYDVMGNLTQVSQGNQTRTYSYDMLSRITSASTPEMTATNSQQSTEYYSYTGSGGLCSGDPANVCQRTDARGVTTTYNYDALNRLTSKSYGNDPSHTLTAYWYYDQSGTGVWGNPTLGNPKGRLTSVSTKLADGTIITGSMNSYDAEGRIQDFWQCTPYNCANSSIWHTHYVYDLAGDITSWTHPAGFTLTNSINSAQQVTQIKSSLMDSTHPQYLAQNITYTPWGAEQTLENGCAGSGCTNTLETYAYNNRLQPVMIELGNTSNPTADYCMSYNYYWPPWNPTSCTTPGQSGNNIGFPLGYYYQDNINPSFGHLAYFGYDVDYRLAVAQATPLQQNGVAYNLNFSYDRYGNMTCQMNGSTNGYCGQYSFNQANQITNSGFTYDAAGDLTSDGQHTYQYDAEGRLISVDNGSTLGYTYDASGARVENRWPSAQGEFLYDPAGTWLGVSEGGTWTLPAVYLGAHPLAFYRSDQNAAFFPHDNVVSSTTMYTSYSGVVGEDTLFYPWGGLWSNTGVLGYQFGDFTWMEGDPPIDYATHRAYGYDLGRWLTPDPLGGDITNPQSLNRYAYALNNPTTFTDPLGLQPDGFDGGDCSDPSFADGNAECQGPGSPYCMSSDNYDAGCLGGGFPFGGGGGGVSGGGGGGARPGGSTTVSTGPTVEGVKDPFSSFAHIPFSCVDQSALEAALAVELAAALGVPPSQITLTPVGSQGGAADFNASIAGGVNPANFPYINHQVSQILHPGENSQFWYPAPKDSVPGLGHAMHVLFNEGPVSSSTGLPTVSKIQVHSDVGNPLTKSGGISLGGAVLHGVADLGLIRVLSTIEGCPLKFQ